MADVHGINVTTGQTFDRPYTQQELDCIVEIPDEVKWDRIRTKRNQLLGESDYIILADAPVDGTQKQEWTTYRQALRDIPQDYDSPNEVVYPDKPE